MNTRAEQYSLALGLAALALAGGWSCAAGVDTGDSGPGPSSAASTGGGEGASGGAGGTGGDGGAGGVAPGKCESDGDCASLDTDCLKAICVSGTCTALPGNDLGSCEDGLWCTSNDICQNGICVGGTSKYCPSDDACNIGICDEAAQGCTVVPGNDGAQCDDMDPCTNTGTCNAGACSKGTAVDCSIFNGQCTMGVCDPQAGCQAAPANEGGTCDDGLFCNIGETCQSGLCAGGGPNPCAPPGGCFIASCDESADQCTSVPGNDGAACDDLSPCTDNTSCSNGACINGTPSNDGAACNDGTMCTTGEFCSAGVCGGGAGPQVYFSDDFHDNSKGWTLDGEWQIGLAMMSFGGQYGNDPATDYSSTVDNGVAGIVLGGNANIGVHPYQYLTSPTFDASAATTVILGFRRWLNSDFFPYMNNTVEVWNGSAWIQVWQSGDDIVNDVSWQFIQHDLTPYKNAAMRIRFGQNVDSATSVYTVGSWNVDDVLVAAAACP